MSIIDDQGQPKVTFNKDVLFDRHIDELIGICKMAASDGVITQDESEYLLKWMKDHEKYANEFPINILYKRLSEMLEDDVLDAEEQVELLELILQMTGEKKPDTVANGSTDLPIDRPEPEIIIAGSSFVFTGVFTIGTRKVCEEITVDLGGEMHKGVKRATDYLVIGDIGSDHWVHSSFGRKIEKAVTLRDVKDTGLRIISEHHWIKYT